MRLQWPHFLSKSLTVPRNHARPGLVQQGTWLEYSTRRCPDELKLDSGHNNHYQGKYNSAYNIGFVVYTCLRFGNVMKNVMKLENAIDTCYVSSLATTRDTRWRAWTGGLRVVTELVSERFPGIKFHSQPAIATIIIRGYGPCISRGGPTLDYIVLRVTAPVLRRHETNSVAISMA
ncbi:hypothetical protein TIFTF001_043439, partial [Ficus carica]